MSVTARGLQFAPELAPEQKTKILLVDDTPENLVSLEATLSGLGEELVFANSGKEALRHLLSEDFAVILLDVRMPEMDGFETAEMIRSRPRSRQTPILFLTGYRNEEHLFRGYDLGAVDFLFKPIVPEVLRSKVAVFVELSRSNAKAKAQADALRRQAEVLQKAEQKFRSLLEAAPDAMVMCRDDGEILMVNSQTEVLFNCSRDKLLSRNIKELVPGWAPRFHPGWEDESVAPRSHGLDRGVELYASLEGGERFPVEISFSPLQTEEGVIITSAIRDISERKKAEEQIRELNATLEERVLERTDALMRSNEELQQFAYIASHDLQEPLRTVSIYAQLLAKRYRGELQGDADRFIDFIVGSAGRMERLIHDLLDFSRIDARGTDFFVRTSCESALDDATRNVQSLIEENGARIRRLTPLPVVIGDPVQLTRLFQNLLVNSIRYRGDEPPRIDIGAEDRGNEWLLSVRDNGIGIEPQYAEKVFGIFKILQPREKSSGSGMGLAICRKIVSRHEGRIWVDSELGKGATFYFTLLKN
jgi:PAS domain S-box-containing protein